MPKKVWVVIAGCCLSLALAGCSSIGLSSEQRVDNPTSPVMKDVYNKSVSGDIYAKGQITPP